MEEEFDLKETLNLFWSKRFIIITITIILCILGIVYSKILVTPKYTARASMILAPGSPSDDVNNTINYGEVGTQVGNDGSGSITSSEVTINNSLLATYRELAKSSTVIRKVIEELENDNINNINEASLKSQVDITSVTGTQMINITVTNTDPYLATTITNKLADIFSDAVKATYKTNNISVVDYAEVPTYPSNINTTRTAVIFAAIGLFLSIVTILIINLLDNTIKTAKDIEKAVNLPVLAELPQCDFSENSSKRRRS